MAHSTYSKATFERKWSPATDLEAKTQLIAWYHIPEGFKISELEIDIALASAETQVDNSSDPDPAIQIHNIGYYSLYGMFFQMPSDGEVDFSTVANLESRIMELLPSTIWTGEFNWDNTDGHDVTALYPHVESHAEMENSFSTSKGLGVHGHIVSAQEHSTGAGSVKPHVFYTEDHNKVGALYGKGFVVAEDKQRFVDRKHVKFKKNLYAHHGRGDGMLAIIMSTPHVKQNDAWIVDDDNIHSSYLSSVMYDPKNNERNNWIRTFDPEGVFETLNMPDEGTDGEPQGSIIYGQLANPVIRSSAGSTLAVNPSYWTTYVHFEKIHVRPISKKDDAKRNMHLNTL